MPLEDLYAILDKAEIDKDHPHPADIWNLAIRMAGDQLNEPYEKNQLLEKFTIK